MSKWLNLLLDPAPKTARDFVHMLENRQEMVDAGLFERARALRRARYGDEVFLRGLIELTNFCKNDCLYCGIRRGSQTTTRYRLTEEEVLSCCELGDRLGLRTFVLQGGEDPYLTDARLADLVRKIKRKYPRNALTLSLGERSRESYRMLKEAGADRYLLRHETASPEHYRMLHPPEMQLASRMECLCTLKELGFQVGAGFMVGTPGQTFETLAQDLCFLQDFKPHMTGIGPFVPHHDTPFAQVPPGSVSLTLFLLGVVRVLLPGALLPATTALGTVAQDGWEQGMLAGANVIMPNLTPAAQRVHYNLYDGKSTKVADHAELIEHIRARMEKLGMAISKTQGNYRPENAPCL